MADPLAIGFIGAGRTAGAVAPALEASGYRVAAVASRTPDSAARLAAALKRCKTGTLQDVADAADLVFVTTPDGAIAEVARQVVWRAGQSVAHCAGALTLEPLEAARRQGAETGSWHPVQTFRPGSPPEVLHGATIGIEAAGPLLETLRRMAERVGAVPLEVPAHARPLYHAAAVMSCGYVAALLDDAATLWERAGLTREAAVTALTKLSETTVHNVATVGAREALTGPAVRGDNGTILLHLEALAAAAPEASAVYRVLAERCAALARE